jgi:hypothetical protein
MGFSFSNGAWSYSTGKTTITIDMTNHFAEVSSGGSIEKYDFGSGTYSQTLSTALGSLTMSTDGTGDLKINAEGGFLSVDLGFAAMNGTVAITKMTLDANLVPSWVSTYLKSNLDCSATLAPVYTNNTFDGFSGSSVCKADVASGLIDWTSSTYSGTFNSGDFLNMVPGVAPILQYQQNLDKTIDSYSYNNAATTLASYMSFGGLSLPEGCTLISSGAGWYVDDGQRCILTTATTVLSQDPDVGDPAEQVASDADIGDASDVGMGSYSHPVFTRDESMMLNMRALLGTQQASSTSLLMNANGDSTMQDMIYYGALASSLSATTAGFIFGGGPLA